MRLFKEIRCAASLFVVLAVCVTMIAAQDAAMTSARRSAGCQVEVS